MSAHDNNAHYQFGELNLNQNACLSNSYLSQHGMQNEHPGFPAINVYMFFYLCSLYIDSTNSYRLDKYYKTTELFIGVQY